MRYMMAWRYTRFCKRQGARLERKNRIVFHAVLVCFMDI